MSEETKALQIRRGTPSESLCSGLELLAGASESLEQLLLTAGYATSNTELAEEMADQYFAPSVAKYTARYADQSVQRYRDGIEDVRRTLDAADDFLAETAKRIKALAQQRTERMQSET